ncbi:protein unc-13 homolog [Andrographis paniculata]|uniref:protein unc-13 homolog n=1 Tax=Andrographis paniculata TaxID=175694 RepID=UPI0021E8BA5D|nr:protein unc-13 homolog [Andrographis paniculata]
MDPFGELGVDLSPSELRETAYEILVGACRATGSGRRLTYVSSSNRSQKASHSPSMHKSLTNSAASKVKKALGLKPRRKKSEENGSGDPASEGPERKTGGASVGELMRVQMRISEQTDSRIRRGLLRLAAGQLGRRIESMVLPLELLQQLRSSDFTSQQECEAWQRKTLKVLESGLLVHPYLPLDKSQMAPQRLLQILHSASEKSIDTGKHSESMHILRSVVTSLACRSFDGSSSDVCHWADGVPLNLHLYKILLEACFDVNDEASVVEEVDEILEQIKKTWVMLGINKEFHNLSFMWVLFHQYVATGEIEDDLLSAIDIMMLEVEKDADSTHDPAYSKILNSTLRIMLDWAEKRLHRYHDTFYRGTIEVMQHVLSLGITATKLLLSKSHDNGKKRNEISVAHSRVEAYIRSSVRSAYSQEREKVFSSRKSSMNQPSPLPLLSILAQNLSDMAFNEKEIYSPVLKRWHPLATGVAAATLHTCYANELKKFVSGINELTPEAIQVLLAAEKLEKHLVEMAVADSVDSEDGGKAIIQEMAPYEAEAVISKLVKSWIRTRIERLGEWVERNLQQEDWNPQVNKGRFAPSAVEVLRIMDETLEAFFLLPIPMHPVLLPELLNGLDKCLQNYITKTISSCGSPSSFLPPLPGLTRCRTGSKFSAFKRKDRLHMIPGRKSHVIVDEDDSLSVPRLCLRINTLYNIRKDVEALEMRTISNLKNCGFTHDENIVNRNFGISAPSCLEGIRLLSEATAYKIVFHDLRHVLLDYLYLGDVSSSRIEPFLQELERNLEVISVTVHDRVRTRVITDVMKASFEGFLFVLLAGGRAFTLQDALIVEEDFKFLTDLFWSNGDGLPAELIGNLSTTAKGVIALLQTGTEELIDQLRHAAPNSNGASTRSKLPLPPTTCEWSATDPDTILRILCCRNDKVATKFLKKAYDLPKRS